MPVRAVKVVTVEEKSAHKTYEFSGEVRARTESSLGFRVAGKIIRRQAELGQKVRPGQILAQLDSKDYQLAVDAGQALVRAAATQRDLAQANYKRYQELRDQNFISSAELERYAANLESAKSALEQAQAQLTAQDNQTAYTNLVADVAGVVTAVAAEPGQVVAAGTPVVRIAQDGVHDVVFSVPEDLASQIKLGTEVDIRAWLEASQWKGSVREIAASADAVTRTFMVKVGITPAPQMPLLGSTAYVQFQLDNKLATMGIKIPMSALRKDTASTSVWVLDEATMRLKAQPIKVESVAGNGVLVSGLQAGMKVVSAGVHVLSEGQKVQLYKEKPVSGVATDSPLSLPTSPDVDGVAPTVPQ